MDSWIQKKLVKLSILDQTPELPRAYNPTYRDRKKEFERFDINENTIWYCRLCNIFSKKS